MSLGEKPALGDLDMAKLRINRGLLHSPEDPLDKSTAQHQRQYAKKNCRDRDKRANGLPAQVAEGNPKLSHRRENYQKTCCGGNRSSILIAVNASRARAYANLTELRDSKSAWGEEKSVNVLKL